MRKTAAYRAAFVAAVMASMYPVMVVGKNKRMKGPLLLYRSVKYATMTATSKYSTVMNRKDKFPLTSEHDSCNVRRYCDDHGLWLTPTDIGDGRIDSTGV
jgi:hypothetical protein